MAKYKPFPFQERCIEEGLKVLKDKKGRSEIIVAATAAGKSIIIAEIVNRLPKDGNIIVLQPSKELLLQNLEKIESLGIKPAVYSASVGRKEIGRVTYATPLSLKNTSELKGKNFKYILLDECDLGSKGNSVIRKITKDLKIKSKLGLTASPIYLKSGLEGSKLVMMNRDTNPLFKDICAVVQPHEMVKLGRWTPLEYIDYGFDGTGLELNSNGSDFSEKSVLKNYLETDGEKRILDVLKNIPNNESVLIYTPGIDNVISLKNYLGEMAVCIHSKMKSSERDENVLNFKSGKARVMVNDSILIQGFDYPNLKHIIDVAPTKSARIYLQKIGRAVRVCEGKTVATIHDLSGNYEYFGKVEDFNFDKVEPYGWGMFSQDRLLTGVPLSENVNITKEQLKKGLEPENKNKKRQFYDFQFKFKDDPVFNFGKHKGKKLSKVYEEDRGYLLWIIKPETQFNFGKNKNLKLSIEKIFKKRTGTKKVFTRN